MGVRVRTAVAGVVLLLTAAGPATAATPAAEEGGGPRGAPLPVDDASTDPGAPTGLEAGLWADTLAAGDQPHQFTYTRTMESSTVHVGVGGAPTDPDGDALAIEAFEAGGDSCASDNASSTYGTPQAVMGTSIDIGPSNPDTSEEPCTTSPTIRVAVSRGSSESDTDLPIVVKIVEEAPVVGGAGDLPTPAPSEPVGAPDGGPEVELDGATSFADAPDVTGGDAYTVDLTEGDQRLFSVALTWGQALDVRAEVPALSAELQDQGIYSTVSIELVDPMRHVFTAQVDDATSSASTGSEPVVLAEGVPPLLYLRRFEGAVATLPGTYWVVLNVSPAPEDRAAVDVPVTLTVGIRGEKAGAPTYPENVTGPGGSDGPADYRAAEPYLVGGRDRFSSQASDDPVGAVSDNVGEGGGFGPRRIGGTALLVVSLGLCVAGALRLRRRPA